jgi:penicillin amidase
MRKTFMRLLGLLFLVLIVGLVGSGVYVYRISTGSLARLDGQVALLGLDAEVTIERDAAGIPTVRAPSAKSRSFAVGYLHGQDRFFQMDLLRRVAAGELSSLVGSAALANDKTQRIHQFRERARQVVEAADESERELLEAYAAGVNAGLRDLSAKPFEYYVLGVEPVRWLAEDSVLCLLAMFIDLQGKDYLKERARHTLSASLPKEAADYLAPKGTQTYDAPIVGEALADPPLPGPEVFNIRQTPATAFLRDATSAEDLGEMSVGSNNWAVAGKFSKHGGAMVANDMHLGIRVPNIWYRMSLVLPANEVGGEKEIQATGVSLPGAPAIIVGSNGKIAWGFTNSEGDWSDLVIVEVDPSDPQKYKTPDGVKTIERVEETIDVAGGTPETFTIEKTIWGPIVGKDHEGRPLALRWVAHDVGGVNLRSARMMEQQTIEAALAYAATCGGPAQNFTVADHTGRIGWTIMGRIPKRRHDGWLPLSWADGKAGWDGYLEADVYPRVLDPEVGRIWTANSRIVSGEMLATVGFGGYDLGARQKQIRDGLLKLESASEADMLAIQLDDRALFWTRWQELFVKALTDLGEEASPVQKEALASLKDWGAKAAVDSVGYRIAREAHLELVRQVLEFLTPACRQKHPDFQTAHLPEAVEESVWRLVTQKPEHFLDARYASWDECVVSAIDAVLAKATADGKPISAHTWGAYNTLRIEHPMSAPLTAMLGEERVRDMGLNMPRVPVPGGSDNIPRIARPSAGASQRMAVSPGRENEGYFHMPCGQSGHPLSPYYKAGHDDWVQGRPSPFLPGEPAHRLALLPKPN